MSAGYHQGEPLDEHSDDLGNEIEEDQPPPRCICSLSSPHKGQGMDPARCPVQHSIPSR